MHSGTVAGTAGPDEGPHDAGGIRVAIYVHVSLGRATLLCGLFPAQGKFALAAANLPPRGQV